MDFQLFNKQIEKNDKVNNNNSNNSDNGPKKEIICFKMVAKTLGQYLSIYDGKTEYSLGVTMHQPAKPDHKGGFYVYDSLDQAIFADIPLRKEGLYFSPRTVLRCMCWGQRIEYPNGKIAVEYICPVQDMGMPKGYLSTKTALREAYNQFSEKQKKSLRPGSSKKQPSWKN